MEDKLSYLTDLEEYEKAWQEDAVRMKHCYPRSVYGLSDMIEEECDRLEYEGSMMYAKVMDSAELTRLVEKIMNALQQKGETQVEETLVIVLLVDEMYVRRLRKCRRDRMF